MPTTLATPCRQAGRASRSGVVGAAHAVEVWCDVPADVARGRYAARARAALHEDARRLAEDWDDWAARAEPLALTTVVTVDTSRPVVPDELVRTVRLKLGTPTM
jgi:predicted kinase